MTCKSYKMIENNINILLMKAENKNYWRPLRFYFGWVNLDKSIYHNWNKDNALQSHEIKFFNFNLSTWNPKTKDYSHLNQKRAKMSVIVTWSLKKS